MKKIIAFLFISSLVFVISTTCETKQKKCADGNTKDSTYCHLYGREGTGVFSSFTDLYRACPKGQKCVIVNGIGQCLQKSPLYAIGEACKVHSECQSGNCKEQKCAYLNDGDVCNEDRNCGLSSYCSMDGKCTPLKKAGEECVQDKQCEMKLACGTVDDSNVMKCTAMFSLEKGSRASNEKLCKSGYVTSIGNVYYCADATIDDYNCTITYDKQCKIKIDAGDKTKAEDEYGTCRCHSNGNSFCEPLTNSDTFKAFLATYEEEMKNIDATKVHQVTMRDSWWGSDKLIKAWIDYDQFFDLYQSEQCVKEYYYQQYVSGSSLKIAMITLGMLLLVLA